MSKELESGPKSKFSQCATNQGSQIKMQFVTLELRPRLQTCNAFIRLQNGTCSKEVDVQLSDDSVTLTIGNETTRLLLKSIKIIPESMSALSITDDWICFRVQTKSTSVFGPFGAEIVLNSTLKANPTLSFVKNDVKHDELLRTNCTIRCACCKNVLSSVAFFERVLPLPDLDYEPDEWFCCKHDHEDALPKSLSPRECDLFYGPFFVVVHESLLNNRLLMDEKNIVCKRCLRQLGKVHTNLSYRLWNCSVDFDLSDRSVVKNATDPFADFCTAIKSSVCGIFGEEVVLECRAQKEVHSLIVKPMDWQLSLITEPRTISDRRVIALEKVSVVQILYRYQTGKSVINSDNAKYCEVGLPIVEAGLKRLISSTKRYPEAHRVASEYYVGHINFEEINDQIDG